MATVTGTLILRPVASSGEVSSTVPSNTPIEEVYKLINEEVCDEGATYVTLAASGTETTLNLFIKYELPENVQITKINSLAYHYDIGYDSNPDSVSGLYYAKPIYYSTKERLNALWKINEGAWGEKDHTKTYENVTTVVYTPLDLEAAKICLNSNDFGIAFHTTISKNMPNISQNYIEIDCEYQEGTGTPIYFKQNGLWSELSGTVYQKTNGTWAEADVSVLTEEYPVEEVN